MQNFNEFLKRKEFPMPSHGTGNMRQGPNVSWIYTTAVQNLNTLIKSVKPDATRQDMESFIHTKPKGFDKVHHAMFAVARTMMDSPTLADRLRKIVSDHPHVEQLIDLAIHKIHQHAYDNSGFLTKLRYKRPFKEWTAEKTGADNIKPNVPRNKRDMGSMELAAEVRRVVEEAIQYLKDHPEEDRVEFSLYHSDIKVWRTKINTVEKYHIGYKAPWQSEYYETSVDNLAEYLIRHGY